MGRSRKPLCRQLYRGFESHSLRSISPSIEISHMLIRKTLHLKQIVRITWKVDLLMLALCIVAYYADTLLIPEVNIPTGLPALMGTAIAFFIGFNNNQAYDRWWE